VINPMEMAGRAVLVTGASSGLGRDVAVLLSQLGARVVLTARRDDALRETLSMMEGDGHSIEPFDLSNLDGIPAFVRDVAAKPGPLAGLVHCAGVQSTRPLHTLSVAHIDGALQQNIATAFRLAQGFRQKGVHAPPRARLVFLTSVMGLVGNPGQSLYSASKGALVAMTRSLALELARDEITVNAVAPGMVDSGMGQRAKEVLTPEHYADLAGRHVLGVGSGHDVANAVAFLLADTGRWITGTTLVVDGGYLAS
jgi:NAD(P)-dependent dehydrogenase (short-subunit alcohol dehydrogenase family)